LTGGRAASALWGHSVVHDGRRCTPQGRIIMSIRFARRTGTAAAVLLAIGLGIPERAQAVGMDPNAPPPAPAAQPASKAKPAAGALKSKKKKPKKKQEKSERQFHDGYRAAHTMIYERRDYSAGIAALHAIGRDRHPDVANLIGFASRKLGRYDDAKAWYEKALAADPRHARTWSYYGMWHAEQGNRLKAEEFLETVRAICGRGCREYVELKGVIDGTLTY
jgi:tetratricopeptide (TPR) repeat protein